jgi:hypothetical protein
MLPDGSAGSQAAEAAAANVDDLDWALSLDASEFWMVVRSDASLVALADTFLRHAARPYDEAFRNLSAVDHELRQHVMQLLHRM